MDRRKENTGLKLIVLIYFVMFIFSIWGLMS